MKVLVTGAAGFIGAALAQKLCERGDQVIGVDNFTPYYDVQLKKDRIKECKKHTSFSFTELDLSNSESTFKLYKEHQPDGVVHLAAQAGVRYSLENPMAYVDSNLIGFVSLIEATRHLGTKHFVFASSSSVYGANTKMPYSVHDHAEHPISLYAATKKANEALAHSYSHLYQIPTTGLRFFTVYGPWGRPDMALFKFTKMILNNETIDVYGQGQHHRDFTYIDDIVEGVIRVLDKPATGDIDWDSNAPDPATSTAPYRLYNIGNHSPVLLADFINILEEVIGKKAQKSYKDRQPGDVPDTYASVADLQRDFDFNPNTSLRDGIEKFYAWYREYYKV